MAGYRTPRAALRALAHRRARGMGDPGLGALIGGIARVGAKVSSSIKGFAKTVLEKSGTTALVPSKTNTVLQTAGAAFAPVGQSSLPGDIYSAVKDIFTGDNGYVENAAGCPVAKVVDVQAHQRLIPIDPRTGKPRRRINVLNVRALSRATRRLGGFQKRAKRVEAQLAKIAPRKRTRRRQTTAIARCS